jgi:hypothetical protein
LAAVERKRSGFQDMAAEGLITFEELGVKLAELEASRAEAQRELETIYYRRERLERLEKDTEVVMRSYARMLPGNLRTLEPQERHEVYHLFWLQVMAYPDGTLLASGALSGEEHVYPLETITPCYGQSSRGSGLLRFSIRLSGSAEP